MAAHVIPGAVVASRYRLDRLLGEGGMGVIWAATHLVTGEQVALKLLRPDVSDDEGTRRRFMREARAAAAVHHPNVLETRYVLELEDGAPVLVMDLLVGESLRDKLLRERRIALPELSRLLLPVISAVGTAHARGIIHRDLKPENIFLGAAGDGPERGKDRGGGPAPHVDPRVKVLDFGIAKLTASDGEAEQTTGITDAGAQLGTPYYMSPEQILGEPDVDHRTDIWSLGIILYEAITAVRPTEAESVGKVLKRILTGSARPIGELAPDLPAEVAALIDRMLSPDRKGRPADLREVGALLERYAAITFRPFDAPAPPHPRDSCPSVAPEGARAAAIARANAAAPENMLATLASGSVPLDLLPARASAPPLANDADRALPLEPRAAPVDPGSEPDTFGSVLPGAAWRRAGAGWGLIAAGSVLLAAAAALLAFTRCG